MEVQSERASGGDKGKPPGARKKTNKAKIV